MGSPYVILHRNYEGVELSWSRGLRPVGARGSQQESRDREQAPQALLHPPASAGVIINMILTTANIGGITKAGACAAAGPKPELAPALRPPAARLDLWPLPAPRALQLCLLLVTGPLWALSPPERCPTSRRCCGLHFSERQPGSSIPPPSPPPETPRTGSGFAETVCPALAAPGPAGALPALAEQAQRLTGRWTLVSP
ncbi:hypothetical protein TREES_T100003915 [Tupaia chinensis]|uniref:Uncharacterized protein n=1 Tax=Tupaia chinensis TaxID=246437 RepID=L9KZK0_TUPCH|nr:hypothetical protein TREES_T100003915 [Tupaia chinensis]